MGERKLRYTEEQYQYARYEANVVDYALGRGYHLVKSGPHYRLAEHDSMVFTPDGRWFWNSRALQGRAIEFAMHYEGMTLPEAVLSICGAQFARTDIGMPARAASRQQEKREFKLPEKAPNTKHLFAYLCGTRGLDREIVAQLVRDGDLYESVYHGQTDVFNAVFVGRDANGTPRSAFQRGLLSYASSPAYKRDVAGSDPAAAFRLAGRGAVDTVIVFEASIDAISHATICKADGHDWQNCDRIALGGTQKGIGLEAYLEAHPQVRNVTLSFDADDAGSAAADKWEPWLKERGYTVTRLVPTAGKDWNEALQERKKAERVKPAPALNLHSIDELAKETVQSLTVPEQYVSFLKTAANNHKYPFGDQLLIFAQKPDAVACADIPTWNRLGRWVNKGVRGIALPDYGKLRYVWNVSDTTSYYGKDINLWRMEPEFAAGTIEQLEQLYGQVTSHELLAAALLEIVSSVTVERSENYIDDLFPAVIDSDLAELSEEEVSSVFKDLTEKSASYIVLARCGIDADSLIYPSDFEKIARFNTPETMSALGAASSEIAKDILRDIERSVRQQKKLQAEFAKLQDTRYNEGTKEEGGASNETGIPEGRRVRNSEPESIRSTGDREVWPDAPDLSEGASRGSIYGNDDPGHTESAPGGDRPGGDRNGGASDERDGETRERDRGIESAGSDEVGGADEQLPRSSGGSSSERPDLQLTLFPTVEEQQIIIEEAESVPYAPFAFSVAQEDIEQILRYGSNTDDSRMNIVVEFSKGKSPEERAAYLKAQYRGGFGLHTDHGDIAAWYADDGIHLARGNAARYVRAAQIISWEDAAKRIGKMLDTGSFANNVELAEVGTHERQQIARSLWELYRDLSGDAHEVSYLSRLDDLRSDIFPDETARLAERIADPEFRGNLIPQVNAFQIAYGDDRSLLRFHYHKPHEILRQLQDLDLPRTEYHTDLAELPAVYPFITEDEINAAISGGSGTEGGKFRIYEYFRGTHTAKEKADFLKTEYGTGGRSHALSGATHSSEDHSAKGERFRKEECADVSLSWGNVTNRIDDLIAKGRYLTELEQEKYRAIHDAPTAYNSIKEQHPDDLVLYQVGDFFEFYGEDAKIAVEELDLYLTSRKLPDIGRVDMCGIPARRLEVYVEKLRDKHNVTISAVNEDTHERHAYTMLSVDHEAERAINAHEAEFGADGYRAFPGNRPEEEPAADLSPERMEQLKEKLTDLQQKAVEIAKQYEHLSLQDKIGIIAQTFGCTSGRIETSPCSGKWRGTSDISIRFDNGAKYFLGNRATPKAKTVKVQNEYVTSALKWYNPEIVQATKETALAALMKREEKDAAIAAQKGLKPYTVLNVELNDGADLRNGGYIGWYYVTLAVDGKIITHLESGLANDIFNGKVSENPTRERYFTAGALNEADVDYVFDNVGFSSTSDLYSLPLREDVLKRAEKALAERTANAQSLQAEHEPDTDAEPVTTVTSTPSSINPPPENFRITDDHLGEGGPKAKFRANMDAINLLKELEFDGRQATPEEQEVLSKYVGWGGLADAFDETKENWASEFQELYAALSPEEYAAARASTLNAHFTSPTVISAIYDAVGRMGFTSGNILEPSMGVGNFFGMLPSEMSGSKLYGVELDSITGRIAKQLYPNADIAVAGFETTNRQDFYDLAVGNVPFGQYQVNDPQYNKLGFSIHNYFFAKALDQVRPGGVVAFVTSRYTLDAKSPTARKYLAERADFLGAIRLPNNAFKANAGTDVVSDIIFLQKRDHPITAEPDWVHLGQNEDGFAINSYFVEHPEMILGRQSSESTQFGKNDFTVEPIEGMDLKDQLADAVKYIRGTYKEAELHDLGEGETIRETIPADPDVKNYSYAIVDGKIFYRENSVMVKPDLNATAQERVKGLVALRNCVHGLIDLQMDEYAPNAAIEAKQAELNDLYDSFTAKHGLINDRANRLAFSDDSSYYLLCSLEVLDESNKLQRKADIFSKRTIKPQRSIDHVDTAVEALAVSIGEKANVDLSYMAQLCRKTEDEIISDLHGIIFKDPAAGSDPLKGWQTADEYLSGNVRRKLSIAQRAAEQEPSFQVNVEALQKAQPKDLDASEIEARLGATWIDKEYIQQFMEETFNPPYYLRRNIQVNYSPYTAEWQITGKSMCYYNDVNAYVTYGTDRANAYRLLEDALNLRDIRIYDTIRDTEGKERRVLNAKETTLAAQKQQVIRDTFKDWLWRDPDRRQTLVTQYNEEMNSTRPREYDGSHIVFSGMNPEITLREHQRNAIAHVMYGGNTLLAHEVGAGKTFEMIAAAMESKRLGLCSKSIFVVPNHLTEQWASEFLRLYPSANILVTTKKDFETHNRQKFCSRIATGDYDAVIIGHSQFEKIPISKERQVLLLQEQIEDITAGIDELKYNNGEHFSIKQLERTKKSLEVRLEKLLANDRKDDVITFEQLGVDRMFVDESDNYKNLFLYTKMRNVAGLSTTDAQKSSDMFLKCRYMDEITGNRGVIFATGTPVSNSMTEVFTIQRYLQYDRLQEARMGHFDCWASRFGETTTTLELAPEGTGYRTRTRFAKFFNLPELMNMFKEVADIKTADELHLPTPEVEYHTYVSKPTEFQKEMVKALSERATRVHSGSVDSSVDNMLKITSDGRKLGLDQRIINPMLPDEPGAKVNQCVANILKYWREGEADKLTQLVFCDISTPKGRTTADEKPAFTVYKDIRQKLIAGGMPPEQIAFIHDADTEVRKKELFAKVRSGQVRVLLGSTEKMGAGTNVQDRLIASHDLDCPWRPRDLTQREGRIRRQGNRNKKVHICRYVTEGTFDAYLWQTVENKQKFIAQIMTSKSPVRTCDDVDETALSFAEIKALCAGDPRIKERMDLDVDVSKLKIMKADHQSKQYRMEDNLMQYYPEKIREAKSFIQGFKADMKTLAEHPHPTDGFAGMEIRGDLLTDKENAGAALLDACKEIKNSEPLLIGHYRGFSISVHYNVFEQMHILTLKGEISHRAELGADARGNLIRIDNALEKMPERLKAEEQQLENLHQQQELAKAEVGKPFPHEQELATKTARLIELDMELNLDKKENEIVSGASDTDMIANAATKMIAQRQLSQDNEQEL